MFLFYDVAKERYKEKQQSSFLWLLRSVGIASYTYGGLEEGYSYIDWSLLDYKSTNCWICVAVYWLKEIGHDDR